MIGFFFYLFAAITVASAFMVISARNPVHAVLFLILAFFNAAGLFLLLGAEFLAMMLVVVYVGAVMVLFLFVVMMLDVDFAELRAGFARYLPIGATIGGILLLELVLVVGSWALGGENLARAASPVPSGEDAITNTEAIGRVLYTQYVYFFEAAGLILLVAMIGAILLTQRERAGIKRQNIADQVARRPATAIEVKQVESGEAIFPSSGSQG
ncbi:MAG: NADH-quinone oxidoreductase subunit J [Hyphomicrobiaceae bacterium]